MARKERTVRTLAERLAAAKAEAVALEQRAIEQAKSLLDQAQGWEQRSSELVVKAEGARAKARAMLTDVGIEPDGFIAGLEED